MKLFNLFKKKCNECTCEECKCNEPVCEECTCQECEEGVYIEQPEELVAVKAKNNFTLAKEYKRVKRNDVFELTKDRAEELEKKGLIKIL